MPTEVVEATIGTIHGIGQETTAVALVVPRVSAENLPTRRRPARLPARLAHAINRRRHRADRGKCSIALRLARANLSFLPII